MLLRLARTLDFIRLERFDPFGGADGIHPLSPTIERSHVQVENLRIPGRAVVAAAALASVALLPAGVADAMPGQPSGGWKCLCPTTVVRAVDESNLTVSWTGLRSAPGAYGRHRQCRVGVARAAHPANPQIKNPRRDGLLVWRVSRRASVSCLSSATASPRRCRPPRLLLPAAGDSPQRSPARRRQRSTPCSG